MRGMIRPAIVALALIPVTTFLIAPAHTQTEQLIDCCGNKGNAVSSNQRIDACSALIQSAKVFGQGRSWAYDNRCAAYLDNNQPDVAIADCNQAIEFDPTAHAYLDRIGGRTDSRFQI
jgi:hypothetical protein